MTKPLFLADQTGMFPENKVNSSNERVFVFHETKFQFTA